MKYYFTFGVGSPLGKHYHVIEADSEKEAREEMFRLFGNEWAFDYTEQEWKATKEMYDKAAKWNDLPEYNEEMTQADLYGLTPIT